MSAPMKTGQLSCRRKRRHGEGVVYDTSGDFVLSCRHKRRHGEGGPSRVH